MAIATGSMAGNAIANIAGVRLRLGSAVIGARAAGLQRPALGADNCTMQTDNRILDDLARAASGALGLAAGMKAEVEARLRSSLDRWLKAQDFVTREEFEAVKAMAARARGENESLLERVAA